MRHVPLTLERACELAGYGSGGVGIAVEVGGEEDGVAPDLVCGASQ